MHVKCSEQVGGGEQDVARPSAEHLLHGAPAPPLPAEASGPGTSVTNPSASTYTVDQALDHIGFGRFQLVMILYSGFAWLTDAMEVMLLSYLGPAVACQCECLLARARARPPCSDAAQWLAATTALRGSSMACLTCVRARSACNSSPRLS